MCLYGDFENAMVLINNFNIQNFPPFFSAIEKNANVVYNYLQKKDLPQMLELSKESRDIALQHTGYRGKRITTNTYTAFYTIGKLLNGDTGDGILHELEQLFPKVYFLTRIQIAWALAIAYKKREFEEKFEEKKRYLLMNVPNCKPLHDFEL